MENEKIEAIEEPLAEMQSLEKPKKPRTEAQIKAFELARQKRDANRKAREEERIRQQEEEKKAVEEKIVKKAVSIKKKQIKKQQV